MDHPDVRRAQMTDQEAVGDLWTRLLEEQETLDDRFAMAENARDRWGNDFPLWLDDETRRIYVAEGGDEIVGFSSARRWGPPPIYEESSEVYLDELYVRPSHRRQGLGTQLLSALRTWANRLGARRLRLSVLFANEAAQAFWTSQDAQPLTMTYTLERDGSGGDEEDEESKEGSKKIGF